MHVEGLRIKITSKTIKMANAKSVIKFQINAQVAAPIVCVQQTRKHVKSKVLFVENQNVL